MLMLIFNLKMIKTIIYSLRVDGLTLKLKFPLTKAPGLSLMVLVKKSTCKAESCWKMNL